MKLTILNGNQDVEDNDFDQYLNSLTDYLKSKGVIVNLLNLKSMNIKQCIGCFGCWTKKPGQCLMKDDHSEICKNYISSDFVLFASPLIMGFTSSLLKKATDRLLPLLRYSMELVEEECHHVARYEKYPQIGVLIQKEEDSDIEDIEITNDMYKRFALNFKSTCKFTVTTEKGIEEVYNEINTI